MCIVWKVINLPAAGITRYNFYTKICRKTPPSSSTMVGLALSGKLTQPTTHPPRANTTPLASNGIRQSISKHRFNPLSNFGNHAKFGTRSYAEPRTETPPPKGITQRTHHDGTPHTSNQTNLQKNQSPREQNVSLSYSKNLQQAKPNIPPSHYPHSVNRNLNDRSNGQVNSLPIPYCPPNMRKSHSKPLKPPRTPMLLPVTTQTTSQPNHNRSRIQSPAVKSYQDPVINNKTPITQLPAIPALLPTATNNRCTMPPMNQRNANTTRPSNHQPNVFNSTRHPRQQPIDRTTVYSTNTQQQLDPATRSFNHTTGNLPAPFQHTTPSTDQIINPAPLSWCTNGYFPPPTEPPQLSSCTSTVPLSIDHPNSIPTLKEALLRLNKMADRLFSIIALMPIIDCQCVTETSPSAIPLSMRNTSTQKHDTIPPRTQPNIYELMSALLPISSESDDCSHPQELKHTLTSPHKNSQETTYRTSSSNLSAKNNLPYYKIGTSDLLQKNFPQSPMYTKDLWKLP